MGLGTWFKGFFSSMIKVFKKFITEAFGMASQILIAEFKDFAIDTVKNISIEELTNDEKRDKAIETIKDEAKSRGKNLSESLIRILIELAIRYLKEKGTL